MTETTAHSLKVKSNDCSFAAYQKVATFQISTAVWLSS